MEAQRFPGRLQRHHLRAPGNNWTNMMAQLVWVAQAAHKDDASNLPAAKLPVIHKPLLAACDARDGVKDGVIEDPTKCKFDPKVMPCKTGDGPSCLTGPQVETVRKIYSAVDKSPHQAGDLSRVRARQRTGLGPNRWPAQTPTTFATDEFKYVVFKNPNWDYKTLNFDSDIALAAKIDGVVPKRHRSEPEELLRVTAGSCCNTRAGTTS